MRAFHPPKAQLCTVESCRKQKLLVRKFSPTRKRDQDHIDTGCSPILMNFGFKISLNLPGTVLAYTLHMLTGEFDKWLAMETAWKLQHIDTRLMSER